MSIDIKKIQDIKKVDKPWGYEKWIADGSPNFRYALKEILLKSKFKSSIQFHEFKEETNYIQKGEGILHYDPDPINFEKYKNNEYSEDEFIGIMNNLKKQKLYPGMVFHIKPGIIHRVEAITDLTLIESSTIELDDVIRINDEWGRHDGKIEKEHQKLYRPKNYYLAQTERIKFAKNYAYGKVLLCSYGVNTQYFCSNTLLDSKANEVWHYDSSIDENASIRKLNEKNDVEFIQGRSISEISEKTFDCIITLEEIQFRDNPKTIIEKYSNLLKDNGVLILSTMNSSVFSDIIETDLKVLGFSKDNLLKIIKPLFSDVQIFSQRNISNIEQKQQGITVFRDMLSKLKHNSKKILTNIDKNQNFYKLHMQKTVLRFRDKQYDVSKKIFDIDYTPISFDKSHNPQTFLLLCKK
jgi:2-polyprenyl-3-methyl-5-hydroxy-6-metoxy-1,4-benzoquinol methylase/mannose-6-phosphate isomerase-like protein (cupin superfamily)